MNKVTLVLPNTLLGDVESNHDIEVQTIPSINDVVFFDHTDYVVRRRVYLLENQVWAIYLEVEKH